jgi:cell division protein FtsL
MDKLHYTLIAVVVASAITIFALAYKVQMLQEELDTVRLENIKLNVKILNYETKKIEDSLSSTDPSLDAYLRARRTALKEGI